MISRSSLTRLFFALAIFLRVASLASAQAPDSNIIIVNYHRDDENYNQPGLWTWDDRKQKDPTDQEVVASPRTDYGVRFLVDRRGYGNDDSDAERIGFIPRLAKDWNQKDGGDRFWTPQLGNEIWLIGNDPKIYTKPPDISPRISSASLDDPRTITLTLSSMIPVPEVETGGFTVTNPAGGAVKLEKIYAWDPKGGKAGGVIIKAAEDLDPAAGVYTVAAAKFKAVPISPRRILMDPALYGTDQPLGAVYTTEGTTFRVFSPLAESLSVLLFDTATSTAGKTEIPMKSTGKGVWEVRKDGDLEGKFYRLKVHTEKMGDQIVIDPWATNTTGNDGNARITDIRAQDPTGFRPIKRPFAGKQLSDAVIYQLHIRDFTINASSGVDDVKRGKFEGFVQAGTTLPGRPDIKTAIDHLKELGVTHVQLQPLEDFDNDESKPDYSWGYMTGFFNSPDGSFASDIRTAARVKEFKELVKALKDAGIGVVMDVVYNHTGSQNTLEQLAPGYFLRQREDGSFWNGSGTGNEFKSESPMGRRFIIDSCKFWATEYGIDGFRFDLMGLIDKETMVQLRAELTKIDPSILLYGEPWAATGPEGTGIGKIIYKQDVRGSGLAAFNDNFRDALKGSTEGNDGGYIQNGSHRDGVIKGIAGSIDDWAASPRESVNYMSVHDNLDLWDKLQISTGSATEAERVKMVMMGGAILGTSQGAMLLHGGTDFCRYKQGDKNSYASGDRVNAIDWTRKKTYLQVNEYYRGIIALRKAHPVFHLGSAEEIHKRLKFEDSSKISPNAIVFSINGEGLEGEEWKKVYVYINPDPKAVEIRVPFEGVWKNYNGSGLSGVPPSPGNTTTFGLTGRSVAVIAQGL